MSLVKPNKLNALRRLSDIAARLYDMFLQFIWITPLAGNRLGALKLITLMRLRRTAVHRAHFAGRAVDFRNQDVQALREVLVDTEYGFLADAFDDNAAPTVLDIGGHIGTFPIWFLSVWPRARILSVEADPETFNILSRNAASANDGGAQWTVLHGAAGSSQGTIVYLSTSGPSMGHRIDESGTVPVSCLTLPVLLDRIAVGTTENVDLLKIDIEGSEEEFLCAAPDALRRANAMVVELHRSLCDTQRVEALLAQTFEEIRPVRGRFSNKPLLYCTRRKGTIV